jgi:hypothetical protein
LLEIRHGFNDPLYDSDIHFDLHQFHKRSRAATAATRIGITEYMNSMHVERRSTYRTKRWCPEFVHNPHQFRKVLAIAVWRSAHGCAQFPDGLENNLGKLKALRLKKSNKWWLSRATNAAVLEKQRRIAMRHFDNVEATGSLLHFLTRIAYLSWHVGYTCVDVAKEIHTTPCNVRIVKFRLCRIAEELDFGTFKAHRCRGHRERVRTAQRLRWRIQGKRYRDKKRAKR